jgi:nitrous oxidase accessory protein
MMVAFPNVGTVIAEPKTIVVPDDFSTIQSAIDNAFGGDTIFVKKGNYNGPISKTLIIDKPVSLIGEGTSLIGESTTLTLYPLLLNKTIFGQPYPTYNTSLIVKANNVSISGFTIKTPSVPSGGGGGISVIGDGTTISNCIINLLSLSLGGSYTTISETQLFIATLRVKGSHQNISQTTIFNGDVDIDSSYINFVGNTMIDEISLNGSSNVISGNYFSRIVLEYSDLNRIHNNTCGFICLGSYGHTCSNNTISANILDGDNIWGILMADGSYNVFYDNYIANYTGSHDGYGVAFGGNHLVAENNIFYHNTFLNNNKNVGYNWQINGIGNSWDNGIEGNYWDDYNGTDANGDGIGDTPYIIDENNRDNYPLMELYTTENSALPTLPYAPFDLFPEPDSIDISLDTNISISISRPPQIVNMSISPEVEVKERIDEVIDFNGRYTFILSKLLEPNTTYSVTMVFGDKSAPEGFAPTSTKTWNFTTVAEAGTDFPIVEVTLAVSVIVVVFVVLYYSRRKLKL